MSHRTALLGLLLLAQATIARAEQPVENCLPGSSCWARLQSVEALGARTADIASEVERLANRDPELTALATELASIDAVMEQVQMALLLREKVEPARLRDAQRALQRRVAGIRAHGQRYAGYKLVLAELESLSVKLLALSERLPDVEAGDISSLVQSIELLTHQLATLPPTAAIPAPKDPESAVAGQTAAKIAVADRLADVYGMADFRIAVMAVPDPRVPRYRRNFDLTIEATMRAMSAHGAHLDRFNFPWRSAQKAPCWGDPIDVTMNPAIDGGAAMTAWPTPQRDCTPDGLADVGILTFRKDCRYIEPPSAPLCPRVGAGARPAVVVLYIVAERSADGPDAHAARAAAYLARWQSKSVTHAQTPPLLFDCYEAPPSTAGTDNQQRCGLPFLALINPSAIEQWADALAQFDSNTTTPWIRSTATGLPEGRRNAAEGDNYPQRGEFGFLATLNSLFVGLWPIGVVPSISNSATTWIRLAVTVLPRHAKYPVNDSGLTVLAPLNSSAVGPWTDALASFDADQAIRWISPTVTALPRDKHDKALPCQMSYSYPMPGTRAATLEALACNDSVRWEALAGYFGTKKLTIFSENSRYGDTAQSHSAPPDTIRFTPGVWELQLQTDTGSRVGGSGSRVVSRWERKFARELLFDDKDRGDEFPERFAHAIGARTQELAFENSLRAYRERIAAGTRQPTAILASDVRDQLVVARAVRVTDPDAQLVFFDADELLAHPAYVGATRGALVVPAGPLEQCGADGIKQHFAKDEMALVFRALHVWLGTATSCPGPSQSDPAADSEHRGWMIVTRGGLRGKGALRKLRYSEILPGAAIAVGVLLLLMGNEGKFPRTSPRLKVVATLSIAITIVLALMIGVGGAHVGPGVSPALAGVLLVMALGVGARSICRAMAEARVRREVPLLDPAALPAVPRAWRAVVVAAVVLVLHGCAVGRSILHPNAGPTFRVNDVLYTMLPYLADIASAVALVALAMAYRAWSVLRRDCSACGVGFDAAPAARWVGSAALPPFATPYLAKLDDAGPGAMLYAPDIGGLVNRRRILAADISALRVWLHGSAAICLLGVLAVQAYPVAGHAQLLLMYLLLGLICVGFALILLVSMARNTLLSALFTGSDRMEIGPRFITLAGTAVLIAAGLLYLAIAPDGSEWYDGVLVPLLSWFK